MFIRSFGFQITSGHGGQGRLVALNIPYGHFLALLFPPLQIARRCTPFAKMRSYFIILFLIVGCTPTEKSSTSREYVLLGELKDDKGRLTKKAETGWIPGEDIWLKITRFDSVGNLTEEYGAKPYGDKYKETFKYDNLSRVIENSYYSYKSKDNEYSAFENYDDKTNYELKDTLVNWNVTGEQLEFKVLFSYDEQNKMTRERHYSIELDSLTKSKVEMLTFDTLYKSVSLDSLKVNK